jgi:hypothetical protein
MATTAAGEHSDELAEFGYKQELDRFEAPTSGAPEPLAEPQPEPATP